jgi:parallel beta-helix repeat protein
VGVGLLCALAVAVLLAAGGASEAGDSAPAGPPEVAAPAAHKPTVRPPATPRAGVVGTHWRAACVGPAPAGRPRVYVRPGQKLRTAVDAGGRGTTFCIRAGRYRISRFVVPERGQSFVGQPGAVISGAKEIGSRFVRSGRLWVASGQLQRNPAADGRCHGGGSVCRFPNDVFLDDRPLRRVLDLEGVGRGEFFFDHDAGKIWIADDPRGHRVEASVATRAFRGWFTDAHDVAVRGLVIEKFANEAQHGAIQATTGWVVENNEVRLNHGVGIQGASVIRRNVVSRNGQLGIGLYGSKGDLVADNEIAYNNWAGYDPFWEAGGTKFARTAGLVVRRNRVHHNRGPGLWTDWDNVDVLYERNTLDRNTGPGLLHEASYDAIIRRNVVTGNGFGAPFGRGLDGAGISLNTSQRVVVTGNTVSRNRHGIGIFSTDRGSGDFGVHETRNVTVSGNTIVMVARGATGLASNDPADYTSHDNRFQGNRYTLCPPAYFAWARKDGPGYDYLTREQWVAAGNDTSGTFRVGC